MLNASSGGTGLGNASSVPGQFYPLSELRSECSVATVAVMLASDSATLLVAPLSTKLDKPTALQVRKKIWSGTIHTCHSSPRPGVLASHAGGAWPA